jgi:hypothetical protein
MYDNPFTILLVGTNEVEFLGRPGCAHSGTQYVCTMANGLAEHGKWRG